MRHGSCAATHPSLRPSLRSLLPQPG
jgi:hypothetical protein